MKNGPAFVFRALAAIFLVLGIAMLLLQFADDRRPAIISAIGLSIMSVAMFSMSREFSRTRA